MHVKRGRHHRLHPGTNKDTCPSRLGGSSTDSRDGLHRPQLPLHPRPRRQEVRIALQGRRRSRVPLHPPVEHVQS